MNMRKILMLLLALSLALSLVACGGGEGESESESVSESVSESESAFESESETESESDGEEAFDYRGGDYSEYLTLEESVYAGKTVFLPYPALITDAELDAEIESILRSYGTRKYVTDRAVKEGDTVLLYYQGLMEKEGEWVAFEGGTSKNFGSPQTLTIGSGQFIDGFEDGLVGAVPRDTCRVDTAGENAVTADGTFFVNLRYTYLKDGEEKEVKRDNIFVDLAENRMGEGFATAVLGMRAGEEKSFECRFDADSDGTEDTVSMTVKVTGVLLLHAHETTARFPDSYPRNPSLAGKSVKFLVWIDSIVEIISPELTEQFIKETLKFESEESDLIHAFREQVRANMQEARDEAIQNAKLSAAWDDLLEGVAVLKLPERDVAAYATNEKAKAEQTMYRYMMSGNFFASFEEFVISYYGLDEEPSGFDADAYFERLGERAVTQRMLFHLLRVRHGLTLEGEALDAAVDAYLAEAVASRSTAEKTYTKDEIRAEIEENYGIGYLEYYVQSTSESERVNDFLIARYTVEYASE